MKNLGFRVPLAIVNKAHQANQLYPFAISLIESIGTYERILEKLEQRPSIVILVSDQIDGLFIGLVNLRYK